MIEICKPDVTLARLVLPQKPMPGLLYIPSQFVLPFLHNGEPYAYNLLTKQCLKAELPRSAHAGEGFDALIESMFLVPEGKDECAYYESVSAMIRLYAKKKGVNGYTILPTLGCNARCVYCYEEGRRQVTMTPEIADQTLRCILNTHKNGKVKIIWFGGEPLLCPDIIDRISDGLREAGIGFHSTMVSNGSLITPEILDKMRNRWNLTRIQISMDGAEHDYRARKRYYGNPDRYRFVLDAIDRLASAGILVSVRCNIDEDNLDGLPQFAEDLGRAVKKKENVRIYFSPLGEVRLKEDDIAFWEKVLRLRPLIENAGFRPISYQGLHTKFRTNYCMADAGSLVIGPDGSLYACEHCSPESRFGDVFNGITDKDAQREFCRTDRTREKCRTCPFLPECTSFSSCPWHDTHCFEVKKMIALDTLHRMIERKTTDEKNDDEDHPVC